MSPRRLVQSLLVLSVVMPALAATSPILRDGDDAGAETSPLDLTRHAMPAPEAVKRAPAPQPVVGANPLWAVPLSTLTATRERPLFTPSRRPPQPAIPSAPVAAARPAPPPPPVVEHPNLTLVGTIEGTAESLAVFLDPATHASIRLHTGEAHHGWVLRAVDGRTATLAKSDHSETLELPKVALPLRGGPSRATAGLPAPAAPGAVVTGTTASGLGGCVPEVGC